MPVDILPIESACIDRNEAIGMLQEMKAHAFNITGDKVDAQDLMQDVAVRVLTTSALPLRIEGDDEARIKSWLYRIMYNVYLDGINSRNCARRKIDKNYMPEMVYFCEVEKSLTIDEIFMRIKERFGPKRKETFEMYLNGWKLQEIGEKFGINTGTLKSSFHHMKKHLNHQLKYLKN